MSNDEPKWVDYEFEQCPYCGSLLQVLNTCDIEGCFNEGDEVRCTNEDGDCEATNLRITCIEEMDGSMFASVTGDW